MRGAIARRALLNPFRYGFYSLAFFSHKILRRLLPFSLLFLLVSSAVLSQGSGVYALAFVAQLLFYACASIGALTRSGALGTRKVFFVPFFYCLANAAALLAFARLIGGRRVELWQPPARPPAT